MMQVKFRFGSLVAIIRIDGKMVTYQDSIKFFNETPIERLLKSNDLERWNVRMAELNNEDEILDEIKTEMEKLGFIFDRVVKK